MALSPLRLADFPTKDPLVDTDEISVANTAAKTYHHIKRKNFANQVMRRFYPARLSGKWVAPQEGFTVVQGSGLTAGRIFFVPFRIRYPETISQLGTVQMSGTTGNLALGIYANASALPSGTTPLGYTSSIACSAAGAELAGAFSGGSGLSGGNLTLQPDVYWWACMCSSSTPSFQTYRPNSQSSTVARIFGASALTDMTEEGSSSGLQGYHMATTYGTWPDVTGASWTQIIGSDSGRFCGPFWKVA